LQGIEVFLVFGGEDKNLLRARRVSMVAFVHMNGQLTRYVVVVLTRL